MIANGLTSVHELRLKLYVPDVDVRRQFYIRHLHWPIVAEWAGRVGERGVMFDTGAGILEVLEDLQAAWPVRSCAVSLRVTNVWALWEEWQAQPNVVFGLRDNPWGDTSFGIVDPGDFQLTFFTPQRTA